MRAERTADRARGRWHGILVALGVDAAFLRDKHGPCPACGGKDRFRFDDKDGAGTYHCSQCGAGDGFSLLMKVTGKGFAEVAKEVDGLCHLPANPIRTHPEAEEKREWCRRIWSQTADCYGTLTELYIKQRLGVACPPMLRHHNGLRHRDTGNTYPAMVARIINATGEPVGLHRTYLSSDGKKANIENAKMSLVWKAQEGAAVRLCAANEVMGIAEGLETALAACKRFAVPCWSSISANGLLSWMPPTIARRVVIFGDNDQSFTGQAASYGLAKRLKQLGLSVDVMIPEKAGTDWADEL